MKAVVDTNVVAYLLFGAQPFGDEARLCFDCVATPLAPAHWEAEVTNVVWMAARAGVLAPSDVPARLGLARLLGIESVATATICPGCAAAIDRLRRGRL
jgi:predicted nucleic acid-binding protein